MRLDKLTAYELIEKRTIDDLKSGSYLFKHKKSGARIAILENDDENKVFYIGFRTPPKDSTGVAHILEHSVLCGSEKYPLKDPFVELAKGSLNTFLNAMTFPDKTVYPIASCNNKDFKNLMDVYLDAVFYPNIYKEKKIFMQEGWHYDLSDADDEIKYNGVVYNEMKGAFSSADDVLNREIMNSLYPDTAYGVESGGDPENIPDLSYEDFLAFHKKYYHPSNSYVYLYGNADMEERLIYLDEEYLSKFDSINVDSFPGEQKPFDELKKYHKFYPITQEESEDNNTYLSYNAVVDKSINKEIYIAFQIIDYALVDSQGTPLKKALLDAGIGTEITSLFENGIYQPFYSIVAKNANDSDEQKFVEIINNTLNKIVCDVFDKNALEAGLNVLEFKYREADFGSYPTGLFYGLYTFDSWLYDDTKPFNNIECNDTFKLLRTKIDSDYFEQLVKKYLIDNNHKTIVTVSPKKGLLQENEKKLKAKLESYKRSLSEKEVEEIIANTKSLLEYQETSDTPEMIAKIPLLKREDLERKTQPLINKELELYGIKTVFNDVYTNGITYVNILFEAKNIPQKYLPYFNIMQYIYSGVDTDNYSYDVLGYEIDKCTGDLSTGISCYSDAFDDTVYKTYFSIKIKAFTNKIPEALKLTGEFLFNSHIDDFKRVKEIVSEIKSRKQSNLISSGHSVAFQRALSYLTEQGTYMEQLSGIDFFRFMEKMDADFDSFKDEYLRVVTELTEYIFTKENMILNVVGTEEELKTVSDNIEILSDRLYPAKETYSKEKIEVIKKNEAFTSSAMINYVAQVGSYKKDGLKYSGTLKVLKTIMAYEYLWSEVRVKGGAYGCFSMFLRNCECIFVSYRDPNLSKTIDVYRKAAEFIENFDADEEKLTKYIIGTMSELDVPLTPRSKGERSFIAYLIGITYEQLQKERNEVLDADIESIRKLALLINSFMKDEAICVIGNEEAIKKDEALFKSIVPLINN